MAEATVQRLPAAEMYGSQEAPREATDGGDLGRRSLGCTFDDTSPGGRLCVLWEVVLKSRDSTLHMPDRAIYHAVVASVLQANATRSVARATAS